MNWLIILLRLLFGAEGPDWLVHRWLAVGCDITAPIWQCLPLWIVILLGGRMAIPQDLYDAADIDGASVYPRVAHVTVPLLGNLYLDNTLISAIGPSGIVRRRCSSRTVGFFFVKRHLSAQLPLCLALPVLNLAGPPSVDVASGDPIDHRADTRPWSNGAAVVSAACGDVQPCSGGRAAILVQYLLALNDPPDRNGFRLKWFGNNACAIIIDDVNSWDGNTKIRRLELQQFHWLPSL